CRTGVTAQAGSARLEVPSLATRRSSDLTSPATGGSPATNSAPRRSRWGRRKQCRELLRQLRPDARCFVLEEDERVLPPFPQRLHRLDPLLEILVLVALVAQPHVAEVGGGDERRMALLRVRDAQRR